MLELEIDGKKVQAPEGSMIIEAAALAGVEARLADGAPVVKAARCAALRAAMAEAGWGTRP